MKFVTNIPNTNDFFIALFSHNWLTNFNLATPKTYNSDYLAPESLSYTQPNAPFT